MASFVILCHEALVTTDVSEERIASIIRVARFGTLIMEAIVPPKRRFLQDPRFVTFH
jgi:hypothetical protein